MQMFRYVTSVAVAGDAAADVVIVTDTSRVVFVLPRPLLPWTNSSLTLLRSQK